MTLQNIFSRLSLLSSPGHLQRKQGPSIVCACLQKSYVRKKLANSGLASNVSHTELEGNLNQQMTASDSDIDLRAKSESISHGIVVITIGQSELWQFLPNIKLCGRFGLLMKQLM